jgi:hypothetical protein
VLEFSLSAVFKQSSWISALVTVLILFVLAKEKITKRKQRLKILLKFDIIVFCEN